MKNADAALEATGVSFSHSRRRPPVFTDCSFRLPRGRVCGLIGPNGAGKSTLLRLAAGLLRPASGNLSVLGRTPAEARPGIAYLAQRKPLHSHFTVAGTLRYGAEFNGPGRWDQEAAERIAYGDGALEPGAKVRSLSGGQRSRVALALAFGKRPELMLLDEPMADIDALARRQLTGALLAASAEYGTTIVMASHILSELEESCDFLFLLAGGRLRLGGETEDLVAAHTLLTGTQDPEADGHTVIERYSSGRGSTALVRTYGRPAGDRFAERPTTEEVVLAHIRNSQAPPLLTASAVPEAPGRPSHARAQEDAA
ncbi:ABC transporter ATP-binding protein [Streptomyces sp. HNM0575]|uniref:ATP-binding cassette domain-containing protein n=1 Tax=Streptomyces sp. HNM0575 TaxID=2716338 RepID=UPI00145DD383|nr:ABC transporter ATP-binding protein [Streptomyces sp. HNM0575]NLU73928.1 ABC transporter ATP-binding protein [Streptomyces sp. HNM0575]